MSILIKGMKMPSSCNDCLFGHWLNPYQVVCCELLNFKEYPADYTGYKAKRLDKCPLEDVPVPHGPLIDINSKIEVQFFDEQEDEWSLETVTVGDYLYCASEIPGVVVEAEGDKE